MFELLTYLQAWRENRKLDRVAKREAKYAEYRKNGLNGPKALARRAKLPDEVWQRMVEQSQ